MADIEMVKPGLRCCKDINKTECHSCPYDYNGRSDRHECTADLANGALTVIEDLQAEIERLQPKKGHWEMKEDPFGLFDEIPVCSECGCTNAMRKKTDFCEHCGADMKDGDGEKSVEEMSTEEIEAFLREKEPFMFEWGDNTGK